MLLSVLTNNFSLLLLSLSTLFVVVVVVIVINVLQIILGGARAFFFFIRASISFSSDMQQNTTSDWPIRVTFSFLYIKNVVFRDSLIDR